MKNASYTAIYYDASGGYKDEDTFVSEKDAIEVAKMRVAEGEFESAEVTVSGQVAEVKRNKGVRVTR
jgi:hypothetical protein